MQGRFVWYELLTTDVAGALAFYPEVVGWKPQALGDYTMFVGPSGPLGGVAALPEMAKQAGVPAYWQGNIQVADVDATCAKLAELGGKVLFAETVPAVGRLAVVLDPQGAVFALFAPNEPDRSYSQLAWHELYTSDHAAAFAFYRALFGWDQLGELDLGPLGTYLLFGQGGVQLGGMLTMTAMPPGWLYYTAVDDLDAAIARATSHGARLANGPRAVPTGQRVATLFDPQGAAFALTTVQ